MRDFTIDPYGYIPKIIITDLVKQCLIIFSLEDRASYLWYSFAVLVNSISGYAFFCACFVFFFILPLPICLTDEFLIILFFPHSMDLKATGHISVLLVAPFMF